MIPVLLSVRCVNPFGSETPESFFTTLNNDIINRIKMLAAEVKRLDVYSIEVFFFDGLWSGVLIDDVHPDIDVLKTLSFASYRVEAPMLQIFSTSFCFAAIPKHAGDDMALITTRVPLTELENQDIYIGE